MKSKRTVESRATAAINAPDATRNIQDDGLAQAMNRLEVLAERVIASVNILIEAMRHDRAKIPTEWMTPEEAGEYLRISAATVQRLGGTGKLRSSEVRSRPGPRSRCIRRFRKEWLDEFMQANCPPPPPPPVDPATRRRRPKPPWREYIK